MRFAGLPAGDGFGQDIEIGFEIGGGDGWPIFVEDDDGGFLDPAEIAQSV